MRSFLQNVRRNRGGFLLPMLLAGTALVAVSLPMQSVLAADAGASVYSFNIPAGTLSQSLQGLANQSGLELTVDENAVRGLSAGAVLGSLSANQALVQMLAGTDLQYEVNARRIVISKKAGSGGPTVLGGLDVKGKARIAAPVSQIGKPTVLTKTTKRQELENKQIDSLADYARRIDAGVSYNSNTKSINIQGLDENRVLTTVDGVSIPWLYDGARGVQGGVSTYDFDALSKLDVVKSADSSAFGTGALGGVLALQTLDPSDLLAEGASFGGLSKLMYNSADHSWYAGQALAAQVDDTSVLVQASYKNGAEQQNMGKVGGSGSTRTDRNPADVEQENLLVKVYQQVAGGHRFGLTGEIYSNDYNEDTLTSVGSTYSSYTTQTLNKRRRVLGTYDYDGQEGGGFLDSAHVGIYWQRVDLQINTTGYRLTTPKGLYVRDSDLREEDSGISAAGSKSFASDFGDHAIGFGVDYRHALTSEYAAGEDNCTTAIYACNYYHVNQSDMPNVDSDTVGLFVQDRISFTGYGLHVTPGVRFDWYQRDPQSTPSYVANDAYTGMPASSSSSHLSPKILLEYDAADQVTLFAQWSQAFRAPSATELYLSYGGNGSYVSIGNPDLKPETSNGFLIGSKVGDDVLGGKVTVYDNYYRNFIDNITTTAAAAGISGSFPMGVFEYVNRSHVHIYGGDLEAHWRFLPNWHAWFSVVYAVGKDTVEDVHLNSVPPLKGILGVGYADEDFGVDLSTTAAAARNKVETPTSSLNKTGSYGIVDMSAWWQLPWVDGLRLQGGIYNILNATYYDALDIPDSSTLKQSYYSQPGRNAKISLVYHF